FKRTSKMQISTMNKLHINYLLSQTSKKELGQKLHFVLALFLITYRSYLAKPAKIFEESSALI
ncbi:MAG: hypothetical protein ABGA11_08075, partial [Liquorilactobacillus hordei]